MNISLNSDSKFLFQCAVGTKKKTEKKNGKVISGEELMIQQFKEQNSPKNNRKQEIWGKFKAGNSLTPEELAYLAKEAPELYRKIREIMMEREAMEAEMERAESKEEVAQIHLNQIQKVQLSMESDEQAESQAEVIMARVNQIGQAYREFTSSVEYKDKEDMESRTEEQRELLDELERQQEMYRDKIAEQQENLNEQWSEQENSKEVQADLQQQESYNKKENVAPTESDDRSENAAKTEQDTEIETKERDKEGIRRKRKKSAHLTAKNDILAASVEYQDLHIKVRDLYQKHSSFAANTNSKGTKINYKY